MAVWDEYAAETRIKLSNIDTGTTTVDSFGDTTAYGVIWRFVIDNGSGANMRIGVIQAVWDTTPDSTPVATAEVSSSDIGDTSGVSFAVDKSGTTIRLRITVGSDDWTFYGLRTLIGAT